MPVLNKHEVDGPPAINVDLTPSAPSGEPLNGTRWYQSDWTTDQSLFTNPAGRTSQNFWTSGTFLSQVRKFTVALPTPEWVLFKSGRHIFFRIGAGPTQNTANWQFSVVTDVVVNHNPRAAVGPQQIAQLAAGNLIAADITIDGGWTDSARGCRRRRIVNANLF